MRHGKNFNHLGRTSSHRKALLANMAASLIMHKGIITTVAKAKALKSYVEPLITRSKEDSTHNRRLVFSYISDKNAVSELFRDVAVKIAQRPGGYTRILRIANRKGDNAELCRLELVDYNENILATKSEKQKAKTTRRGASKKKTEGEVKGEVVAKKTKTEGDAKGEVVAKKTKTEGDAKGEVVAKKTKVPKTAKTPKSENTDNTEDKTSEASE